MTEQRTEVNPDREARLADGADSGTDPQRTTYELLHGVLHHVDQGIVLVDGDCKPVYVNHRACRILSASDEEEASRIIDGNCPRTIYEQSREKRKAHTYLDITLSRGGKRKLLGLEVFYQKPASMPPFYVVLIHDFSDWKKLDDLRSRFATSLSHCMRTPLTAVRNVHKILGEGTAIPNPDRERLLEIGWRNIEKLIAQLDELQKVFMIESEKMNVCRTLIRIRKQLKPILAGLENEGKIKGFKLRVPDITSLTGRGRLGDFVTSAVEACSKWIGGPPYIECISSIRENFRSTGGIEKKIKLSLRPRLADRGRRRGESLKDFLSYREAHRGLVLNRLVTALDGEMEIIAGAISLLLPVHPPFDREKDLVNPLHVMTERAELGGGEFHLVSLKMIGMVDHGARFTRLLESSLCTCIDDDGIVSRGEEPFSYSIFVANRSLSEIAELLGVVQDRFARSCRQSGEEIYPSIRWEVLHTRTPCEGSETPELALQEKLMAENLV